MRIVHKMIMFILLMILAMLLDVYIVSRVFEIKDKDVAMLIADILIIIYMMCFLFINKKTMWLKY